MSNRRVENDFESAHRETQNAVAAASAGNLMAAVEKGKSAKGYLNDRLLATSHAGRDFRRNLSHLIDAANAGDRSAAQDHTENMLEALEAFLN